MKPRDESSNQSTKELLMGKPAKPAGVHKSLGNGGRGNCWSMCPTQIKHHTRNSRKTRPRKRDQHRWQANHVPGKSRGIGGKEGFKSNLVLIQVEDQEDPEGMSSRGKKKPGPLSDGSHKKTVPRGIAQGNWRVKYLKIF